MFARTIKAAPAALALVLLLGGCRWFEPFSADSGGVPSHGALVVRVADSASLRTLEPTLDMTAAAYRITLSGPESVPPQTIDAPQQTASFDRLEPGEWTVTVHALNADDPAVIIAAGSATVTVLSQQKADVNVAVTPVQGQGTLDLRLEWPDGSLLVPDVSAVLTSQAGVAQDISSQFSVDASGAPDVATYSGSWDAGYYTLTVSLTDEGSQVWGDMIAVRIIAGEVSSGVYSLSESELNLLDRTGALEVNIGADLQNPYTITFSGVQPEIDATQDMTVRAALDPSDPPDAYQWYVNGTLQRNVSGDSITIGPSGIWLADDSSYRLTLVVRRGVTISSQTVAFRVAAAASTTPEPLPVDSTTPDDEYYGLQWHYETIGMPGAWGFIADPTYGAGFTGAVVAVVDSGYLAHPDLAANIVADGYDFISDPTTANDGDGIDPDPTDPGDHDTSPSWHGTHVSGTIAAVTNNTTGVAGVGWDRLQVMPLRVLGVGGGWTYDIVQAIYYAAAEPNDSGTIPTSQVSVINMSLSGGGYSYAMRDAIQAAVEKGITIVCSAGNAANTVTRYPAGYDNTISVSAVDPTETIAAYSSYGPTIELTAPGGGGTAADMVLSTHGINDYIYRSGTSMAAPHVAGTAGLLYAYYPALSQGQVRRLLADTSVDLGVTGRDDYYGYGLIQADAALNRLVQYGAASIQPASAGADAELTPDEIQQRVFAEMNRTSSYAGDRVIVKLAEPQGGFRSARESMSRASEIVERLGLESVTGRHPRFKLARIRPGRSVPDAVRALAADDAVEYAEPVYRREPSVLRSSLRDDDQLTVVRTFRQ